MSRRGRGYSQRKVRNRRPRNVVLIVCEGQKTEVNYFKGFRERKSNVKIIPYHEKVTDPKSIVDVARKQAKKEKIKVSEGDTVWCAFDVDENTNEALQSAVRMAEKNKIQIALSNPSFEIWFLLHYIFQRSELTTQEAIAKLKEFIPDYTKNMLVYGFLKDKLETAIERAKSLNALHEENGIDHYTRESNPSSQVFRLIEFIRETTEKNSRNSL